MDAAGKGMKPDERELLLLIAREHGGAFNPKRGRFPRELLDEHAIEMKQQRMLYLLAKWLDWYDWGVTIDLGWLTPEGFAKAQRLDPTIAEVAHKGGLLASQFLKTSATTES